MADNVAITAGSGTNIASDDIAGVQHQRVKVQHGADGAATDVSTASPLPVELDSTNLAKTEDSVHTTGDKGIMALGVRQDTQADFAADGDYVPLSVNDAGQLRVSADDSAAVLGTTTYTQGTTKASAIAAIRNDDLAALADTDNELAPFQVSQNGALYVCNAANDDYKYAVIDDATSGDNTLVAAVASNKIRVLSLFLVAAGTVNARFEDGAAGTALTGQMNLVANTGFSLPYNPAGWFETSVNTLLNLELSAAVSVDGSLTYIEVP